MNTGQVAILRQVRELLGAPERWTKDVEARDQHGEGVWNTSPSATCWCLVGAIRLLSGHQSATYEPIEQTLQSVVGCENISDWNDAAVRTHEEVIDLLDAVLDVI